MRLYAGELTLHTTPVNEPVNLTEAKSHLRVDVSDDDALIYNLVKACRIAFEEQNGRTLFTTTWRYVLDKWPSKDYIELPRPPLASVTSIKYTDSGDTENTWSSGSYVVESNRTPGRVHLAYGESWPSGTLRPSSPIEIIYVAGWDNTSNIPEIYKQAIKLLLSQYYENRENATGDVMHDIPFAFSVIAKMDGVY